MLVLGFDYHSWQLDDRVPGVGEGLHHMLGVLLRQHIDTHWQTVGCDHLADPPAVACRHPPSAMPLCEVPSVRGDNVSDWLPGDACDYRNEAPS